MISLREMTEMLLSRMMAEIEKKDGAPALVLVGEDGRQPDIIVAPHVLGSVLESGVLKDKFFDGIRRLIRRTEEVGRPVTVFGFAGDTWASTPTDKGARLYQEQPKLWQAKVDKGMVTLLREGYILRSEAVTASVQDRDNMVVAVRGYARSGERFNWIGDAEFHEFPQSNYHGRTKMFGDTKEENLGGGRDRY